MGDRKRSMTAIDWLAVAGLVVAALAVIAIALR